MSDLNIIDNISILNRTIFQNDNLKVLQLIKDNCIDLIYLDPPFNSGTNYFVGEKGFTDKWNDVKIKETIRDIDEKNRRLSSFLLLSNLTHSDDMESYLAYLSIRLIEMQRILKPAGRIALHCDDNASHYLKICLDIIFGKENFRNDIALLYKNGSKNAKQHFPRNKDNVLHYCKDIKRNKFFNTKERPSEKTLKNIELGFKITWNSRSGKWHETYYRDPDTFTEEEKQRLLILRERKLRQNPAEIHVRHATNGKEIKYLDWWDGITIISQSDKNIRNPKSESVGWPTQKNVEIPRRFIETCTQEGDIILDPFCGSGTTLVAAEELNRKWIGIDISEDAVNIASERIENYLGVFIEPIHQQRIE